MAGGMMGGACSDGAAPDMGGNGFTSGVPEMPKPTLVEASLSGRVVGGDGQAVAGATVTVAETDRVATTDEAGRFVVAVPSDSTVTLVVTATGFAKTYAESVMLAAMSTVDGFDVLVLRPEDLTTMNTAGGATMGGVMAVRLRSTSPSCVTAGAHLSVWPAKSATVLYSRPDQAGALGGPDPAMDGVQAGASIDAWLLGAIMPGSVLDIHVEQAGCQVMAQPPSTNGLLFTGLRHVEAGALSQASLYLEQGR